MLRALRIAGSRSASERWPLWEVPLWAAADAAGRPIASMDPAGDALEIYKREVSYLYCRTAMTSAPASPCPPGRR